MSLQISKTLSLPNDAVTQTFAILARKGAGKSYCAGVIAEEMNKNGLPFVWVDPVGAAYGFRSSADGKRPGLPIVILGGEHGDLPLTPETGEQVAKFIISEHVSILLDLSLMRKAEQVRFMNGFAESIYHLNKQARHIFMDEADLFAPQRPFPEGMRLLGAIEDIVRRGRIKGLGFTSITQRAAVLNKDILTQTECLIVLQTTGPQDKKAVKEWVNVHVDDPASKQVVEFERSLPNLNKGQAWIWSPAWLKTFELVQIRKKETFDSSATPKAGQLSKPKVIAEVDLGKLQAQMSSVIEQQKANDPKELRKQITELQRSLKQAANAPAPPIDIDKIVAAEVQKALRAQAREYENTLAAFTEKVVALAKEHSNVNSLQNFAEEYKATPAKIDRPKVMAAAATAAHTAGPTLPGRSTGVALPTGEKAILSVVAQYQEGASREQLTVMTGYKRSSRDAYIQRLSQRGYISVSGGNVLPTQEGIDALGSDYEPLPTGEALREYWLSRLPEGERKILEIAMDEYPASMERERLSAQTDYKRSSRDAYIQRLASRKLLEIVGRGEVRASAHLF